MLTETSTPTAAMNSTLLGMCAKLNMLDTGKAVLGPGLRECRWDAAPFRDRN